MPTFVWEGKTRTGETHKGSMTADDDQAVIAKLRQQNISATKVKKKGSTLDISFGSPVKIKELVVFTRQFATMIDAGLPLVQCLEILANTSDNKRFADILKDIKSQVESGSTFSVALSRHPKVFNSLFVNLVAAGEAGGILDTILNRLAVHIEKSVKLRRRIKGAMYYPVGVLIVAVGIIILMLYKVIPTFEKMFTDFGSAQLPGPTAFLISLSHGLINNFHWIILGTIAFIVGIITLLRWKKSRYQIDKILLTMPVIGPVVRKTVVARFTRTLGTLLSSGVAILDSMDIVAKTAGNMVVEEAILHTRQMLSEGQNLAPPLIESGVFPPMVSQMIGVGEQTGALDAMLQKIADFYEDEVDVAVGSLTSLIEPIMMVVLGGVVGGIIVAMYLPIFKIAGAINKQ
ncbi:MAG: type II secretion system F family protein [Deltaproteobacteria bacterium]|nr:type II secretion system F family protein [Deltaproteobacteria bacterium]